MSNVVCPLSMASNEPKRCNTVCAFYTNGKCLLAESLKKVSEKD